MEIDADLLARFGIDQETFDRLRKTSLNSRAYTRDEYRQLSQEEIWAEQCRASLARSVSQRIKNGFFHRRRSVADELPSRAFATMSEYRKWCRETLPAHLGYRLSDPAAPNHVE